MMYGYVTIEPVITDANDTTDIVVGVPDPDSPRQRTGPIAVAILAGEEDSGRIDITIDQAVQLIFNLNAAIRLARGEVDINVIR